MDYCSTCRRHLNGALVCPGCGAYAPDIAPGVVGGHPVPGQAATTSGTASRAGDEPQADAGWFTAPARSTGPVPLTAPARSAAERPAAPARSAAERPAETDPADGSPRAVPSGSGTGRAARRRQLARWRKTQRRALVATAVALVGGGITLASTDRGGGERAQAATAPDLRGMGGTTGTVDDAPTAPAASPDRTTAPPTADDRRAPARTGSAPATTAPPSRTHTDGTATTEVPTGSRSEAPESVSRSGSRTETSQGTGRGATSGTGGSGTTTRPTSPPPSADNGGTGTGDGSGSGSGTGGAGDGGSGATQPAPGTPPPSAEPEDPRLCLLLLCIG
ncbi:hypothetical protein ABTX34_09980 [Streptomyces sp. NPDC096538]|uniref:SCO2400 family protein n=1 Tax=Streptomyces sp. NPDC096538 TaxID=3155427 RepID=UPI00332554A0